MRSPLPEEIHLPPFLIQIILEYFYLKKNDVPKNKDGEMEGYFIRQDFNSTDLQKQSFIHVKMTSVDLSYADANESNWNSCVITGSNFSHTYFLKANFCHTTFVQIHFTKPYSPNFKGATFENVSFEKCDLSGTDFTEISCRSKVSFNNCTLQNCRFDESSLANVQFNHCQLSGAVFFKTNLLKTQFNECTNNPLPIKEFPEHFWSALSLCDNAYELLFKLLNQYIGKKILLALKRSQAPYAKEINAYLREEEKIKKQLGAEAFNEMEAYQGLFPKLQNLAAQLPANAVLSQCLKFTILYTNHSRWCKPIPWEEQAGIKRLI